MASYVSGHMVNVHVTTREVNGKTVRDASDARKGLLHEGARSLNDEHEQKWAADNPNIRPDFAQQNIVMVQRRDANGDWALTEVDKDGDQDSFLEYGDERVARLERNGVRVKWRSRRWLSTCRNPFVLSIRTKRRPSTRREKGLRQVRRPGHG